RGASREPAGLRATLRRGAGGGAVRPRRAAGSRQPGDRRARVCRRPGAAGSRRSAGRTARSGSVRNQPGAADGRGGAGAARFPAGRRLLTLRLASWRLRLRRISTRPSFWTLLLVLGLAAAAAWSTTRGAVAVPMRDLLPAIAEPTHPMHAVVAAVRLPRIAGAAVVGAALATAGVLIQ